MELEIHGLTKHFAGLTAVSNFRIQLEQEELVGLIGPNGAGKTTTFNLMSGFYKCDAGKIVFQGDDITNLSADKIAKKGLARTFQNIRLMENLTVAENLQAAFHSRLHYTFFETIFQTSRFRKQERWMKDEIQHILHLLDLDAVRAEIATDLPYGQQKKVGIARALALQPRTLLLDEPAAGLNTRETDELVQEILRIKKEFDLSIILVEHDMKVIMGICERIIVMDEGVIIAEGTPKEVQNNEDVINAYLGISQ